METFPMDPFNMVEAWIIMSDGKRRMVGSWFRFWDSCFWGRGDGYLQEVNALVRLEV